jgi:hypothetical protein
MNTDTILKRGNIHPEHCEDAVFANQLNNDWLIGAVMDGCSSGKDSYFASALFSKLIAKACKTLPYLSKIQPGLQLTEMTPQHLGEFILSQVFYDVKKTNQKFLIDEIELLTTLIIAVVNIPSKKAWLNISGDGFFAFNDQITEIDQNNRPDYMTYHLDLPFEKWLGNHTKSYEFSNLNNLTIASDGVNKLMDYKGNRKNTEDNIEKLLAINSNANQPLSKIYDELTSKKKLIPYDDIGIVRFT